MRPGRLICLRAVALAALAGLFLGLGAPPARAAEFVCVDASRYRNLLRIFNEDPDALVSYFRIPRDQRPPANACRSYAITGQIAEGDAGKLLRLIAEGRGSLAELYLTFSGSKIDEEIKLALIIQSLWLKTRNPESGSPRYEPDFLTGTTYPGPSSTTSWPVTPKDETALQKGLKDFFGTSPELPPVAIGKCLDSCASAFIAGRMRSAMWPRASEPPKSQPLEPGEERLRAILRLVLEGRVVDRGAAQVAASPMLRSVGRFPGATVTAMKDECGLEIEGMQGLQEQIRGAVQGLADKAFAQFARVESVMPRFDALRAAAQRLETCVAGTFERKRLETFAAICGAKCESEKLKAHFDAKAGEFIASAALRTPAPPAAPPVPAPPPPATSEAVSPER